jgi:hypothetical protein
VQDDLRKGSLAQVRDAVEEFRDKEVDAVAIGTALGAKAPLRKKWSASLPDLPATVPRVDSVDEYAQRRFILS